MAASPVFRYSYNSDVYPLITDLSEDEFEGTPHASQSSIDKWPTCTNAMVSHSKKG
jgi:hypothetical protein